MRFSKKTAAWILSAVMTVSSMSMAVFAAEIPDPVMETMVEESLENEAAAAELPAVQETTDDALAEPAPEIEDVDKTAVDETADQGGVNEALEESSNEAAVSAGNEPATDWVEIDQIAGATDVSAQGFGIRHFDENGTLIKEKYWSEDDMKALAEKYDKTPYYYTFGCGMLGYPSLAKGEGVKLTDLLEESGISFQAGQSLRLRATDVLAQEMEIGEVAWRTGKITYASEAKEQEWKAVLADVSKASANGYYTNFTYSYLMGMPRYSFAQGMADAMKKNPNSTQSDLYNSPEVIASGKAGGVVSPLLCFGFGQEYANSDKIVSGNGISDIELSRSSAYRFCFGQALDTNEAKAEVISSANTRMQTAYNVFGIDIWDGQSAAVNTKGTYHIREKAKFTVAPAEGGAKEVLGHIQKVALAKEGGEEKELTAADYTTVSDGIELHADVITDPGTYTIKLKAENYYLAERTFEVGAERKKAAYSKGDDISGTVFYIAVDADGNGKVTDEEDAVYYYTLDEIKSENEETAFAYINHGEGETANVKGAKLSTLITNLKGVDIGKDWVIQYMEEDAFHAVNEEYQDTVGGLTDESGVGNGSGAGIAADTMIGWANKLVYDTPNENSVSDTDYIPFTEYKREPSHVRAYRQTKSANSVVLKMLKGVVITNKQENTVLPSGKCGYKLISVDSSGKKIADDYDAAGLLEGMNWAASANVNVPWAKLTDQPSKTITIGADTTQEVPFTYEETPFFQWTVDGKTDSLKRSQLADTGITYPESNINPADGTAYEYYGFNKPMYERYQGKYLKDLLGEIPAGAKVYVVKEDGKKVDITKKLAANELFVSYYYTESKSDTNIANRKRVPLNYSYSVVVDTASAPLEYSNDGEDYKTASGQKPVKYENARIEVRSLAAQAAGVKAALAKNNKSAKISWSKVAKAEKYIVEYKASTAKSWKKKSASSNSITISGLAEGTKYQFRVRAYIGTTGGAYSSTKTVVTLKAVKLTAKLKKNKARISFKNIAGESGYEIYQKAGSTSWKKVKTLKADKVSWTSNKLAKGTTYKYRVRAYKTEGKTKVYGPWSSVKKVKR